MKLKIKMCLWWWFWWSCESGTKGEPTMFLYVIGYCCLGNFSTILKWNTPASSWSPGPPVCYCMKMSIWQRPIPKRVKGHNNKPRFPASKSLGLCCEPLRCQWQRRQTYLKHMHEPQLCIHFNPFLTLPTLSFKIIIVISLSAEDQLANHVL